MYLAIKNNLPTLPLFLGKPVAVKKYDQEAFGIKSWRSGKDRRKSWVEKIWGKFFEGSRDFLFLLR
jgi:hypothetical protein